MRPLYAIRSGRFVGALYNTNVYAPSGEHIGYLVGDIVRGLDGRAIGKLHGKDDVGLPAATHLGVGGSIAKLANVQVPSHSARSGKSIASWSDPDF